MVQGGVLLAHGFLQSQFDAMCVVDESVNPLVGV